MLALIFVKLLQFVVADNWVVQPITPASDAFLFITAPVLARYAPEYRTVRDEMAPVLFAVILLFVPYSINDKESLVIGSILCHFVHKYFDVSDSSCFVLYIVQLALGQNT